MSQPHEQTGLVGPDFNIDDYLNHFIPRPRLYLLPTPVSWFLGYRSRPERPVGSVLKWLWGAFGAFVGLLVVEAVFMTPALKSEGTPIIIGSLGAAAILNFSVLTSPLSQPRNAILSQAIASFLGVSMTKLFGLSPHFESLRFVAGSLAVALTAFTMGLTNTIHPPAGATALLAATSPEIAKLGWFLIPLALLGSSLLVAVACITGNLQQRFPLYWWTAVELPLRKGEVDIERRDSNTSSDAETKVGEGGEKDERNGERGEIVVSAEKIVVPDWLQLGVEQRALLETLHAQLRERSQERGELRRTRTMDTDVTRVFGPP